MKKKFIIIYLRDTHGGTYWIFDKHTYERFGFLGNECAFHRPDIGLYITERGREVLAGL